MMNLNEEELPKTGHVMAVIEAMNMANFELQIPNHSLCNSNCSNQETSLMHSDSVLSLSSPYESSSCDSYCREKPIELEAIYQERYATTCLSRIPATPPLLQARSVCVCHMKRCDVTKKKVSKSLNELDKTENESTFIKKPKFRRFLMSKDFNKQKPINNESKIALSNNSRKNLNLFHTFEVRTSKSLDDELERQTPFTTTNNSSLNIAKKRRRRNIYSDALNGSNNTTILPFEEQNVFNNSNRRHSNNPERNSGKSRRKIKLNMKKCLNIQTLTPIRICLVVLGLIFVMTGSTYDYGLKYLEDIFVSNCWHWLRKEYGIFGKNLMEYQEHSLNVQAQENLTNPINEKSVLPFDRNFFRVLEGLEVSVHLHFFELIEDSEIFSEKVNVNDLGPLVFEIIFRKNDGFKVVHVPRKSKLNITTMFEFYDFVKAFFIVNNGQTKNIQVLDHSTTTASVLIESFVSNFQQQFVTNYKKPKSSESSLNSSKTSSYFSDQYFLPLPLDKKRIVKVQLPPLHWNLTLRFKTALVMYGLNSYPYTIEFEWNEYFVSRIGNSFNSLIFNDVKGNKDNRNTYVKKGKSLNNSFVPHIIDLNEIIHNFFGNSPVSVNRSIYFPFWISSPHFYTSGISSKSAEMYGQNKFSVKDTIKGLSPNENDHGSFIYYHPILCAPMNASVAFQIGLSPPKGMLHAGKYIPLVWLRFQFEKIPLHLWYLFWLSYNLRGILISSFIITGCLFIIWALRCECGERRIEEMV